MRRSYGAVLVLAALACHWGATPLRAGEREPKTIIAEPRDPAPGAITRPAGKADRDWRRSRRAPELVTQPQAGPAAPARFEAPRYDARGRRLNVPGRPDTYDQFGRARALERSAPRIAPSGPVVRTDAATRINQYRPR